MPGMKGTEKAVNFFQKGVLSEKVLCNYALDVASGCLYCWTSRSSVWNTNELAPNSLPKRFLRDYERRLLLPD